MILGFLENFSPSFFPCSRARRCGAAAPATVARTKASPDAGGTDTCEGRTDGSFLASRHGDDEGSVADKDLGLGGGRRNDDDVW